jgi:transposase-like protein
MYCAWSPTANPFLALLVKWASQRRTVSDSIIHAWRAVEKRNKGGEKQPSALEDEVEALKRQLRQTEMEREILKSLYSAFAVE